MDGIFIVNECFIYRSKHTENLWPCLYNILINGGLLNPILTFFKFIFDQETLQSSGVKKVETLYFFLFGFLFWLIYEKINEK